MTLFPSDGEDQSRTTLAAVIAAVQTYLDEEERYAHSEGSNRLNSWKTAPWPMIWGARSPRDLSWRRGI